MRAPNWRPWSCEQRPATMAWRPWSRAAWVSRAAVSHPPIARHQSWSSERHYQMQWTWELTVQLQRLLESRTTIWDTWGICMEWHLGNTILRRRLVVSFCKRFFVDHTASESATWLVHSHKSSMWSWRSVKNLNVWKNSTINPLMNSKIITWELFQFHYTLDSVSKEKVPDCLHAALGATRWISIHNEGAYVTFSWGASHQIESSDFLSRRIKCSRDTCGKMSTGLCWLLCLPSLQGSLLRILSTSWCQS